VQRLWQRLDPIHLEIVVVNLAKTAQKGDIQACENFF